MLEPVTERKFNADTHKSIAESTLHKYTLFMEKVDSSIASQKKYLRNTYNVNSQLISLNENLHTGESLFHLVNSDNKKLSRVIATLASLCSEITYLVKDAEKLFVPFLDYIETTANPLNPTSIIKIIKPLQQTHFFVKRTREVVVVTFMQLCAITDKKMQTLNTICNLNEVLCYLGDLFICLLKIDAVLETQTFKQQWVMYNKAVKNALYNKHFNKYELMSFRKTLMLIESQLLMGTILKDTIEHCVGNKELCANMKSCHLNHEVSSFLDSLLSELESCNVMNVQVWWKINIFLVFHNNVFGNTDKRLIKRALDANKKYAACPLIGNITWYPEQFLLKHAVLFENYIDEKSIENYRNNLVVTRVKNITKDANLICYNACCLFIELQNIHRLNLNSLKTKELQTAINSFQEEITMVQKISSLLRWILSLQTDKKIPVTKSEIVAVFKLVEILKCFYFFFNRCSVKLTQITLMITQHLSHKALTMLYNVRKKFTQEKSYKEHQLDVLSALSICEQSLKRCCAQPTLLIAKLSLSASSPSCNTSDIRSVLHQLETMMDFSKLLREFSNCSFLYWHQNYMLPIYFQKFVSSKADYSRYYLITNALTDCLSVSNSCKTEFADKVITDEFYKPMAQLIEGNLRLQTHLHLQLPTTDSFENYCQAQMCKDKPVALHCKYKSLKHEIEHHLSEVFYNLTSVVLHDWKTYGEMRKLASLEYHLEMVDDTLPMQTLEQGLDVLEIMRNIKIFVSKYNYNLNSQIFIEKFSNNKHLNSIGISHVANSIRTHGIGIMNTTVNFVYQFLRSQFYVLSQFIFDEHIKSRLIKDIRFFNEYRTSLNQMYPFERAEKFNLGIKKLGLNEKGESYLDLFRGVVTQIGNAMGYVRLIRAGGQRCLAEGTSFIPDLKIIESLTEIVEEQPIEDLSKKAALNLLENLNIYLNNMKDSTEYFSLLVKVFEPVLRKEENLHLKNFFIIIPPLTLNFVEHSLNCKEKLNKKYNEYTFTDDGFALGLAYIVELLNQEKKFNSLHWFHSVQKKFTDDRNKISEQINNADAHDTKLINTLTLTEKKITLHENEFQLLYYSYNSARLFFS